MTSDQRALADLVLPAAQSVVLSTIGFVKHINQLMSNAQQCGLTHVVIDLTNVSKQSVTDAEVVFKAKGYDWRYHAANGSIPSRVFIEWGHAGK